MKIYKVRCGDQEYEIREDQPDAYQRFVELMQAQDRAKEEGREAEFLAQEFPGLMDALKQAMRDYARKKYEEHLRRRRPDPQP